MRVMWTNTLLSIVAVILVASLIGVGFADSTIRLALMLLLVFIGVYRLSDVVRE